MTSPTSPGSPTLPTGQFAIGLSLGSDSCVVAVASGATAGRIDVCFNDVGDRVTPAYVAFSSGEVHAGLPAKQTLVRQPMQTVPHVLAMLGSQVASKLRVACEVNINESDDVVSFPNIDPDNADEEGATARYDAAKLICIFLQKVKETVINAVCAGSAQQSIGSVVIAVPRYVTSLSTVRSIAIEAGLSTSDGTVHVIYDDAAAALAAGFCNASAAPAASGPFPTQWVLVVDWGAMNLAATLLEIAGHDQLPKLLGYVHRFNGLGGKKLDEEVATQIAQGFQRKTKLDPMENARSKRKLLQAAETVKKTLSAANTTSAEIEAFCEGVDLKEAFSRVKLESIIRDKKYVDFGESVIAELLDAVAEDHFASGSAGPDLVTMLSNLTVTTQGGMFRIPMMGPAVQTMLRTLVQTRRAAAAAAAAAASEALHTDPTSPTTAAPLVKVATELQGISSDEQAAAGACVQALLALPRLSRGNVALPETATREAAAAGGNTVNYASAVLRTIYLLAGGASGETWGEAQLDAAKTDAAGSCYSFPDAQLVSIAAEGMPLPYEVELQLEPSANRALVFFQSHDALPAGGKAKKRTTVVVPLLAAPVPCPAEAVTSYVLFDHDEIIVRFATADGSLLAAGEARIRVQGIVE